jgi:uncharacterized protein (DUF169 family)
MPSTFFSYIYHPSFKSGCAEGFSALLIINLQLPAIKFGQAWRLTGIATRIKLTIARNRYSINRDKKKAGTQQSQLYPAGKRKEDDMQPLRTDLSVYREFDFEKPAVGVKFLPTRPEGMAQLDKKMALCEMINEAQERGTPFYIDKENEDCAGATILGMVQRPPMAGMGELGVKWGIYQEARVNERLSENAPKISPGKVNYVVFAPLEHISFEPDLLFLLATTSQAEIVLRALSYSTGEIWSSKAISGGACAWLFAYPYLSGNVNYVTTGLTLGLKGRRVYPEGRILFSIPYDRIPMITQNLQAMEWVLPAYTDATREEFLARRKGIFEELLQEFGNP